MTQAKIAKAFHAAKKGFQGLPHPSPVPSLHPAPTLHRHPMRAQSSRCGCGAVRPTSGVLQEYYCDAGQCPMEPHSSSVSQLMETQTGCPNCSSIQDADKIRTSFDRRMVRFYNTVVEPNTDYNLTTLVFPY